MHGAGSRGRLRDCPACVVVPALLAPLLLLALSSDGSAAEADPPCEAGGPILSPSVCPAKRGLPSLNGPADGPAAVPVLPVSA